MKLYGQDKLLPVASARESSPRFAYGTRPIAWLLGGLLPACIYLHLEFSSAERLAEREAAIQAQIVDQFTARNPGSWRFAREPLLESLAKIRAEGSQIRLVDHDGDELSSLGDEQKIFWVSGSGTFHDFGQPAGRVQVGFDMWPKVANGFLLGGMGLLLGAFLRARLKRHLKQLELAGMARQGSQERLSTWLELSDICVWETDAEFCFTEVAGGASSENLDLGWLVGKYFWDTDCNWSAEQWTALFEHREFSVDAPASINGRATWFNIQGKPWLDHDGKFAGYRGTIRDLSERMKSDDNLRIAETAFEMPESILVMDLQGKLQRVNEAFLAVTGYTAEEVLGESVEILKSGRNDEALYHQMLLTLAQGNPWHGELWSRDRQGGSILVELTIKPVTASSGRIEYYVGSFHDITERREAENNIYQLVFFDPLTRLPNRRLLFDRLNKARAASHRSGRHGALMFIDLDNFKRLNDTRGHDIGDMVLCEVALRLQGVVRSDDSVVRLGGDEFVVMLENLNRAPEMAAAEADEVGRKLVACLNEPYLLQGLEIHSTPSVGVVLFRGESQSIEQILKHADAAMYRSKAAGRNTLHFFDPEMQAAFEGRAVMEADLRTALETGQFLPCYQGQVDAAGNMVGAEMLIRWVHPLRGTILPGEFMHFAEDCGLIVPLGQWVLDAACAQLKNWEGKARTSHLALAVNISVRQFHHPDFVGQVLGALERSGADPRKLTLELTESLLMKDWADALTKMTALKSRGVRFSLDAFGTGYSSLSSMKRLPLDQLKIDPAFVRDIERDDDGATLCAAIVALAGHLGLEVVAEGVETELQRDFFRTLHPCKIMQGHLFANPLPLPAFEALLNGVSPITVKRVEVVVRSGSPGNPLDFPGEEIAVTRNMLSGKGVTIHSLHRIG